MSTITRGAHTFDVTESGPPGGEAVVLLHGFPQHASSWDLIVPLLNAAGYRTLALEQRGYSAGAQPPRRRDYAATELVADVVALIDSRAGGRAHVVGHDWGAAIAWALALERPEKVVSLTPLSVPHPQAFLKALVTSRQCVKSWYMLAFQLPWLPERLLHLTMARMLSGYGGQSVERARRDAASFPSPASLRGPINWYRAIPFAKPWQGFPKAAVPTLFIWSDKDAYLGRRGTDLCADYVSGPYRLEILSGVSHWIPEEAPEKVAALLLAHLKRYGAAVAAGA